MENWSGYQQMPHEQVNWAALAQQWMAMKGAEQDTTNGDAQPYAQEGDGNWSAESSKPVFPSAALSESEQTSSVYHGHWAAPAPPPPQAPPIDPNYSGYPPLPVHGYGGYGDGGDTMGWNQPHPPPPPSGSHGAGWYPPPPFYPPFDHRGTLPPNGNARDSTPPFFQGSTLDATSRKKLPAWILEGLEKAEKEKQKQMEKEERLRRAEEEKAKRKALAGKGKFDSSSDEEQENESEVSSQHREHASWEDDGDPVFSGKRKAVPVVEDLRTQEEKLEDELLAVKFILTSLLMNATDEAMRDVFDQCLKERERKEAEPKLLSKSSALAALSSLGGEDEDSDDERESRETSKSPITSSEPGSAFKAPLNIPRNFSKPESTVSKDVVEDHVTSQDPPAFEMAKNQGNNKDEAVSLKRKKRSNSREKKRHRSKSPTRGKRRSRSRERRRSRSRDRKRSRSTEKRRRSKSRDRKRSRSRDRKRSRSRERHRRNRSTSRHRSRSRSRERRNR